MWTEIFDRHARVRQGVVSHRFLRVRLACKDNDEVDAKLWHDDRGRKTVEFFDLAEVLLIDNYIIGNAFTTFGGNMFR